MIPEKPGYYYYQWRPDEEIIVQVFDQGGVLESSLGRVDAEACRGRWLGVVPERADVTAAPTTTTHLESLVYECGKWGWVLEWAVCGTEVVVCDRLWLGAGPVHIRGRGSSPEAVAASFLACGAGARP